MFPTYNFFAILSNSGPSPEKQGPGEPHGSNQEPENSARNPRENRNGRDAATGSFNVNDQAGPFLCNGTGLTVLEAVRGDSKSDDQEVSKRDSGKAIRSS